MTDDSVAEKYASVLLEAAEDRDIQNQIADDLSWLNTLLDESKEFYLIWQHPVLQLETKTGLLRPAVHEHINALTWNFLLLLIQKRREKMFRSICEEFFRMQRQQRGEVKVYVRTAMQLDDELVSQLREALRKHLESDVVLQQSHEPELLAGLVLNVDDMKIDASLQRRLEEVRKTLVSAAVDDQAD